MVREVLRGGIRSIVRARHVLRAVGGAVQAWRRAIRLSRGRSRSSDGLFKTAFHVRYSEDAVAASALGGHGLTALVRVIRERQIHVLVLV